MKNQRTAPRYVRDDISVFACEDFGLSFSKSHCITLVDINSKGALISTRLNLSVRRKITFDFIFDSGKTFRIRTQIIHKSGPQGNLYGVKFDRCYNELGDYLIESQKNLIVK